MNNAARAIARHEAGNQLEKLAEDATLEGRFRVAAKATYRHWMATDENDQFGAAIEAVYLKASEEEQRRIIIEAESLKTLNAMLDGIPVDMDAVTVPENPIGLLKIWREVVEDARR